MKKLLKKTGQISALALTGIFGLISSIAVPIFWVSDIRAINTVQDNNIKTLQDEKAEMKADIKELRRGMDALLIKNGINPDKIK